VRAPDDSSTGQTAAKISNAVVQLLHEYTGRGPTKAKTRISEDLITVVLADTLTRAERNLVTAGNGKMVIEVRKEFQRVMRKDYVDAVEGLTDRKVIAFMSDNHIDPDIAIESFVLEPLEELAGSAE
jgi:uncharacterized protein YbcI